MSRQFRSALPNCPTYLLDYQHLSDFLRQNDSKLDRRGFGGLQKDGLAAMLTNMEEFLLKSPLKKVWQKIGIRHHHGFLLPLLGLHTKQSVGCGEYLDLIPLVDWCADISFDIIQLLPLNDSGVLASPYSALSSCALHPIYLSLRKLPFLENAQKLVGKLENAPEIDSKKRVDYPAVLNWKMQWLKQYFEVAFESIEKSDEYLKFCANHGWLKGYAVFRALKDHHHQAKWQEWPKEIQTVTHTQLVSLAKAHKEQVNFYCMLQYLCYEQLAQVKTYAELKNIKIMGDIPILINPDSADVWEHPHFFDLSMAAGAPPDVFNPEGQYWNFPLYNWKAIEESGYSFWRQRLKFAAFFYHLYRIDHIIGFFRIWAIPRGKPPMEGFFIPKDEQLILVQGEGVLRHMIESSDMLPIAEDLGFMPDGADEVIKSFGIPGTRVIRLERFDKGKGPYIPFEEYHPVNMSMVSTHDLESLRGWWKDYPHEGELFCKMMDWKYEKELSLKRQIEILRLSHQTKTLFHINLLGEYFACIESLRSDNIEDERINRPGEILETNWTYRFCLSVEEMQTHDQLISFMKGIK